MSPSSPRRTSISSTCATMTGARPSVGSSMIEQLRVRQQRAARSPASAARRPRAARRRCDLPLGEPREGRVDALDRPGAALLPRHQPQMLVDGQRAPQPPALRHVADAEPRDLGRARGRSAPARGSGSSPTPTGTRPMIALHSVVLPMPLRPTTDSTPRSQPQVDALQRVRRAVEDVEPAHLERGGPRGALSHGHGPPPR